MKIIVVGFCTMHNYVACNLPAIRRSAEGGGEVVLRAAVMGGIFNLTRKLDSMTTLRIVHFDIRHPQGIFLKLATALNFTRV